MGALDGVLRWGDTRSPLTRGIPVCPGRAFHNRPGLASCEVLSCCQGAFQSCQLYWSQPGSGGFDG